MALFKKTKKEKGAAKDIKKEVETKTSLPAQAGKDSSSDQPKVKDAEGTVSTVSADLAEKIDSPINTAQGTVHSTLLRRPRITEKATILGDQSIYTFDVDPRATKIDIKRAIEEIYKKTPEKVRMITIPKKSVMIRRIRGVKGGGKKALVYMKKGDIIEFI